MSSVEGDCCSPDKANSATSCPQLKVVVVQQAKLVVPHSTASVIVGKSGESIARIQKDSSARVQLQQNAEDNSLQERIITVQGKCRQVLLIVSLINVSSFAAIYMQQFCLTYLVFQVCAAFLSTFELMSGEIL